MCKIIFFGAGDQAEVNYALLSDACKRSLLVFDEITERQNFHGYKIRKSIDWEKFYTSNAELKCCVNIGNPFARRRRELYDKFASVGIQPFELIAPNTNIDESSIIGAGVQIMNGVNVGPLVNIGAAVILNTKSNIEHHCEISDGVEIAPGATLLGRVKVDENSWIGAGTIILPRLSVGKNTIVGAGAVVTKDIPDGVIAYGNPCRVIGENKYA